MPTLVSACLLGRACRYDGLSKPCAWVIERVSEAVAVCPEELGGLGTPRPPADLTGGDGAAVWSGAARVARADGVDVSEAFRQGALRALAAAPDARRAVLKARSPSCGVGEVRVDGVLCDGDGVFAALLRARGVAVISDEEGPAEPAPVALPDADPAPAPLAAPDPAK